MPLDLHEKVLLWLAFRGLKPVSEITVHRRNMVLLRKGIRTSSPNIKNKIKRIKKWIQDAGMFYATEPKYETSWHVSLDKNKAKLSAKVIHKFDYKNELLSGTLFGFPKESVKAYAHNRVVKFGKKAILMVSPYDFNHHYLKNKYYRPYAFYAIRADRVKEDSQTARLWADTIRKEVPTLAKWFEEDEEKIKARSVKRALKYPKITQPALKFLAGYMKASRLSEKKYSETRLKKVFLKIVKVFFDGQLTTEKLSIIAHELIRLPSKANQKIKDQDLLNAITSAELISKFDGKHGKTGKLASNLKYLINWFKKNK